MPTQINIYHREHDESIKAVDTKRDDNTSDGSIVKNIELERERSLEHTRYQNPSHVGRIDIEKV